MKKLHIVSIGLMACLAIGISTARGQMAYTLKDLGLVKGMEASEPAAINNLGHVTGTAYKGEETCAFHYVYKFMEDAGGLNSRGLGISSTNIVVGDSFFPSPMRDGSHAAIFKDGGFTVDLGVLKGQVFSRANGINAMGQVVGFSGLKRDSSESRAFLWTNQTGMLDIGTLGGSYAQANAISDLGFITGTAETSALVVRTHAFIYHASATGGKMQDLGVLGGFSSYGMAINGYNHVAGYSTIKINDERVHGFLHDGKSMIDLGTLGGIGNRGSDVSVALSVNKLDQVVGYTYLPTFGGRHPQQVAFLWSRNGYGGGKMVNLNQLLNATAKNYLLVSATAINDNGQIVASAYDTRNDGGLRAVLLTPVK